MLKSLNVMISFRRVIRNENQTAVDVQRNTQLYSFAPCPPATCHPSFKGTSSGYQMDFWCPFNPNWHLIGYERKSIRGIAANHSLKAKRSVLIISAAISKRFAYANEAAISNGA